MVVTEAEWQHLVGIYEHTGPVITFSIVDLRFAFKLSPMINIASFELLAHTYGLVARLSRSTNPRPCGPCIEASNFEYSNVRPPPVAPG